MESFKNIAIIFSGILIICVSGNPRRWLTPDELDNDISLEDLRDFLVMNDSRSGSTMTRRSTTKSDTADMEPIKQSGVPVAESISCSGLGYFSRTVLKALNMKPDNTAAINTHFYFSSRKKPERVQVYPGEQFGLDWVDFRPKRKTVMIVHGYLSDSNVTWINDMTNAFLKWGDVNVIAVDWSDGGNTWNYWRAVANTRTVGSEVNRFFRQLMNETGAKIKDFHFVGHSLGAHISSYASNLLGKVARITGLDPARPCFSNSTDEERLDPSDADFVDIIHTNGIGRIGFGMHEPMGHADFYPNGGLRQPCESKNGSFWSRFISSTKVQQSVCSHGRAYELFTASLLNSKCAFLAHKWDLSYNGVNTSLKGPCDAKHPCAEMGIRAIGSKPAEKARGNYILITSVTAPFCLLPTDKKPVILDLLEDLPTAPRRPVTDRTDDYADPVFQERSVETTTQSFYTKLKNSIG